ncbi:uncharacterized protein [Anolis sagrei]|uniref:uncharacterized protein isoform X2 n=1 Tax=Anolis sagrei TaxID=38937 RepID=UPI003522FB4C
MPSPRAGASSPESTPDVGMENKSPDLGSEEQDQAFDEMPKDNLAGPLSQEAEAGKAGAEQQEPQTKKPKLEKQERHKKVFNIQVLVRGKTGGCEDLFLNTVSGRLSGNRIKLKPERYREDSDHFLLVFCPVASRLGTDMQNALEHLQGEPKAVLVMLHHKPKEYNRFLDTTLQAQHPAVVLTVHARYTLEDGLYNCQENKEAVSAVANVLKVHCKEMAREPSNPAVKRFPQDRLVKQESKHPRGIPPELASHRLEHQRQKQKPPADRRGQMLEDWEPRKKRKWYSCCKKGEPKAVLVMLHHKPKESTSLVDTGKQAQHRAVECTVHTRFTLEDGFYFCQTNKEAVAVVVKVLEECAASQGKLCLPF